MPVWPDGMSTRMLVIHEQNCQELSQTVKYMSERQEKLVAMVERKRSLLKEAQENFQKQIFQEITKLEERIWKRSRV